MEFRGIHEGPFWCLLIYLCIDVLRVCLAKNATELNHLIVGKCWSQHEWIAVLPMHSENRLVGWQACGVRTRYGGHERREGNRERGMCCWLTSFYYRL